MCQHAGLIAVQVYRTEMQDSHTRGLGTELWWLDGLYASSELSVRVARRVAKLVLRVFLKSN